MLNDRGRINAIENYARFYLPALLPGLQRFDPVSGQTRWRTDTTKTAPRTSASWPFAYPQWQAREPRGRQGEHARGRLCRISDAHVTDASRSGAPGFTKCRAVQRLAL